MKHISVAVFALLLFVSSCVHHVDTLLTGNELLELSRASTVMITSKTGQSKGTGFVIGDQLVATCFHVAAVIAVKGSNVSFTPHADLQVTFPSGEVVPATLVSIPSQAEPGPLRNDFALLRLSRRPSSVYSRLTFAGNEEFPKVGDEVVFSGLPLATPGMVTHRGMVSGHDKDFSLIFVQASINKGNSGGALLNNQGRVVGIVSMREGGISKGLQELQVYIEKSSAEGSVQIMGVDPLQSTRAIILTMDQYISTGIGYARSSAFLRDYVATHPEKP